MALVDLREVNSTRPVILLDSAAAIWRILGEVNDQAEIVERVATHFNTEAPRVEADVKRFLDELGGHGYAVATA